MMKQANKNILNVPKLRFPEFKDNWQEKKLGDIGQIITGKTPSTNNLKLWGGNIAFITPTDIVENNKYQASTQRTITKQKNTTILPINSIVYTCIASVGKIAITTNISSTNQQINSIIVKDNINNEYVYYFLLNLTPYIKSTLATSTFPIINKTEFSKFIIKLPQHLSEQQKIADCLTSLDDIIAAQNQKLNILKTHKKGLMQNLFPANGKTTPKLRFPEFMDAMEWKYSLLGDHCAITTGKLNANAMVDKGRYRFYTCAKNYYLIDKYAFDTEALLVSGNGENVGYIHYYNGKFNAYQRTYILNKFDNDICFIKFILEQNLHRRIKVEKKSGNTPYIVMATLTEMQVKLPSKEEQHKIADCLTSLDNIITAQTKKIDTFKAHKKGLMQQLFPSADEISK